MRKLILGDCLKVLKSGTIPPGSIDLVLADLPYGTTSARWDSVISPEELFPLLWEACSPDAVMIFFAAFPFTPLLYSVAPKYFRLDLVWCKTNPTNFFNAKKRPLRAHENILIFSKKPSFYYCPQMETGSPYFKKRYGRSKTPLYTASVRTNTDNKGSRFPTTLLFFGPPKDRGHHPTQKPVELLSYLIRTFCPPGGLVLDPTMGSGSAGLAAISAGRDFVGIEKDKDYYSIAEKRTAKVQSSLF